MAAGERPSRTGPAPPDTDGRLGRLTRRAHAGRVLIWAAAGLLLAGLTYVVMVRLGPGQRLDDLAMEGRKATDLTARRFITRLMSVATLGALTLLGPLLVALVIRWRRWRSALLAGAVMATTLVSARLGKASLPRVDLLGRSNVGPENSFPSGHSAAAMALGLLAVSLCPPKHRSRVVRWVTVAVVLHSTAVLASGWHRPSDTIGGFGLAVAVVGLGVALLLAGGARTEAEPAARPDSEGVDRLRSVLLVVAAATVLVLWLFRNPSNPAHSFGAFLVAVLVCNLAAVAVVRIHASVLGTCDLDRSPPATG